MGGPASGAPSNYSIYIAFGSPYTHEWMQLCDGKGCCLVRSAGMNGAFGWLGMESSANLHPSSHHGIIRV
jgi:hypothetical protein